MIILVSSRQMSAHNIEEDAGITQDFGLERTMIHRLTKHAEQEMSGMKLCLKS